MSLEAIAWQRCGVMAYLTVGSQGLFADGWPGQTLSD